jgi:hypothetical protein
MTAITWRPTLVRDSISGLTLQIFIGVTTYFANKLYIKIKPIMSNTGFPLRLAVFEITEQERSDRTYAKPTFIDVLAPPFTIRGRQLLCKWRPCPDSLLPSWFTPDGTNTWLQATGHSVKSKLFYDWQSVNQYVLVSSPLWDLWPDETVSATDGVAK